MINIIAGLIGIAIFIVILLIAYAVFEPLITGIIDKANGLITATELKPRALGGETICDLRVKVFAEITQDFGIGSPEITMDKNNAFEATWFDCFGQSNPSPASLIDLDLRFSNLRFSLLDFVTLGGEKIHAEIVIRDANDPTQKVDAFTQPQLRRVVFSSDGISIIKTPLNVNVEFVITNIPQREYDLEIYYGRPINDMGAGEPFIGKIFPP